MFKQLMLALATVAFALALTGCSSTSETNVEQHETKGQQMMDLKEAYETGAITEEEYEELKERVMD